MEDNKICRSESGDIILWTCPIDLVIYLKSQNTNQLKSNPLLILNNLIFELFLQHLRDIHWINRQLIVFAQGNRITLWRVSLTDNRVEDMST
jgi:hypothetical protein